MFHSAGYFRGVPCPFFEHGLCHRPHCHYRHRKPTSRSRERRVQASLSEVRRRQKERAAQLKSQKVGSSRSEKEPPDLADQPLALPTSETRKDSPSPAAEVITFYGSQSDRPAPSQGGQEVEGSASHADGSLTATMATTSSAPGEKTPEDPATCPQATTSHAGDAGTSSQAAQPTADKTADLPSYAPERSEPTGSEGYDHLLEAHEPNPSNCLDNIVVPALMRDIFGSSGEDSDAGNDIHDPVEAGSAQEEIEGEFQKMLATASQKVEEGGRRKDADEDGGRVPGRKEWVAHPNAPLVREPITLKSRPKTSSNFSASMDPASLYMGKERQAKTKDQPSSSAPQRPRLSLTVNAKVPTAFRQKFLDSIIDEHLKMNPSPEEVYSQALKEERELLDRSNGRMVYRSLATNALRKLRQETEAFLKEQKSKSDARMRREEGEKRKDAAGRGPGKEGKRKAKRVAGTTGAGKASSSSNKPQPRDKGDATRTSGEARVPRQEAGSSETLDVLPGCKTLQLNLQKCGSPSEPPTTSSESHALFPTSKFYKGDQQMPSGKSHSDPGSHGKRPRTGGGEKVGPDTTKKTEVCALSAKASGRQDLAPMRKKPRLTSKDGPRGNEDDVIDLTKELFGESDSDVSSPGMGGDHDNQEEGGEEVFFEGGDGMSFESALSSADSVKGRGQVLSRGRKRRRQGERKGSLTSSSEPGSGQQEEGKGQGVTTPTEAPSHQPYGKLVNLSDVAAKRKAAQHKKAKLTLSALAKLPKPGKKPDTPPATPSPTFITFKRKEVTLTESLFHEYMSHYILSEDQLAENGYPRPTEEVGVVSINWGNNTAPEIRPVGPNAMEHRCCRCNSTLIIYNNGQYQTVDKCSYHYGRVIRVQEYGQGMLRVYSCCRQEQGSSSGCVLADMHVTAGSRPARDTGYVTTVPGPSPSHQVYSLDCEMCYTTVGLQLTKVSVVNMALEPVYEKVVKPHLPIVDYNTRFSGLTAADFVSVETTLEDVQQELLGLFPADTILVGHSLESDLRALKLIHSAVVDTSIVFPHRKGLPYKRALKTLTAEVLMKFIQNNPDGGHDSLEDARACMELMVWKVKGDLKKTTRRVPESN